MIGYKEYFEIKPGRSLASNGGSPSALRLEAGSASLEMWEITESSPATHKRALRNIAKYFRREEKYDFTQYCDQKYHDSSKMRAYLICNEGGHFEYTPIGGFCLRYRDYTDTDSRWALQWIWLHPYLRHQGLLKQIWPFLVEKFGSSIFVEPPLSKTMKSFVAKHHPTNFSN